MKKLFIMLIALFVLYFGLQFAFTYFTRDNFQTYEVNNFIVEETVTYRVRGRINNYHFKINVETIEFSFQVFGNFPRMRETIIDIDYFSNSNYTCILPIFNKSQILMDALCFDGRVFVYANTLSDSGVVDFLNNNNLYDRNDFMDSSSTTARGNITVHQDNLIEDHYFGVSNYRGFYIVSKHFSDVIRNNRLFNQDVYNHPISAFVDRYYIVANYNEDFNFNQFIIYNFVNLRETRLIHHSKISFDSYVQGIVNNKLYIYDKENGRQYEIDVINNRMVEFGNNTSGIHFYNNGTWETMTVAQARAETRFSNFNDYENSDYVRIDKVGTEEWGYYYLYRRAGNIYRVYRINVQDRAGKTYLFNTDRINDVVYLDDFIYFIDGERIKYFSDSLGIRTVGVYNELRFNRGIRFGVYIR